MMIGFFLDLVVRGGKEYSWSVSNFGSGGGGGSTKSFRVLGSTIQGFLVGGFFLF